MLGGVRSRNAEIQRAMRVSLYNKASQNFKLASNTLRLTVGLGRLPVSLACALGHAEHWQPRVT